MGIIDFSNIKKQDESTISGESIQIPENLTNPALIAKFKELSEKEKRHENTAAESAPRIEEETTGCKQARETLIGGGLFEPCEIQRP